MTDGENTASSSIKSAYGYLSENRLGTTSSSVAPDRLDDRLEDVCDAMKVDNNILVYTIAFGNPGSNIENLLEDCATNPDYFFNSPSAEDLQAAFRAIGDSLSNLRISK
jgi:hypothetical protein